MIGQEHGLLTGYLFGDIISADAFPQRAVVYDIEALETTSRRLHPHGSMEIPCWIVHDVRWCRLNAREIGVMYEVLRVAMHTAS